MPRPCSICEHPQRADIEKAHLLEKKTGQAIALQFGVSANQFVRHKTHIDTKKAAEVPEFGDTQTLTKLYLLAQKLYLGTDDEKIQLAAIQRMQSIETDRQRSTQAKDMDPSTWAHHPANARILDEIMNTLESYEDARAAVIDRFRELTGAPPRQSAPPGVPASTDEGAGAVGPLSESNPFSNISNTSDNTHNDTTIE